LSKKIQLTEEIHDLSEKIRQVV